MLWAFLSALAGLGDSVSFAFMKRLGKIDTGTKLAMYALAAFPFMLLGFLFYKIPDAPAKFYIITLINVCLWSSALFLMMKSLQISDLSISIPMLSFTPVFLLFVSYILLNEFPSFFGLIGVIIVAAGSYIINISSVKYGYFEPFKSIFRNKGTFYMLAAAFIFSITASLVKIGITLSNPAYFMVIHYLFASIILAALFSNRIKNNIRQVKENSRYFLMMGIAVAFSELLAAAALKFAIVPYVISLKRTSIIFSVLLGSVVFREKHFKEAVIGATIMFAGIVLITLL